MKIVTRLMFVFMLAGSAYQSMAQASCHANFTFQANPNSTIVVFTNTSTTSAHNTTLQYTWNFGDGQTSGDSSIVTHAYVSPGVYNVCLYLHNYYSGQLICTDSICQQVAIGGSLCGNAHAEFIDTVNGHTVLFNSVSTGTGNTALYQWWMDGQIIAYANPNTSFAFQNAPYGTHTFCLYVYAGQNTLCDSACHTITINDPCSVINANWTYSQVPNTDSIQFLSADGQASYTSQWIFGDGATSPHASITHGYAQAGTYTVCHIVVSTNLGCADTSCQVINVNNNINCAGLSGAWADTITGSTVHFKAVDTFTVHHHNWNFGDGSNYSFDLNPTHTYAHPGTYHVCEIVYIPNTNCVDSSCSDITINGTSNCHASFTYFQSNSDTPTIYFTNTSTSSDSITAYEWSFGPGNYSTLKNPVVHFNAYGTYVVCLYITTSGGCTSHQCDTIVLQNPNPCGTLNTDWTYEQLPHGDSVRFTTNSSNLYHHWIFGDGVNSTQPSPIHVYAQPGIYTVCLIVSQPGTVCADTSCKVVTVTGAPHCGTAAYNYYIYSHNSIHAYSTSTGVDSTTVYAWYLWAANGGLVQSQSGHTNYIVSQTLANGTYDLCMYLYTSNGTLCDSVCKYITIDSSNACAGLTADWSATYLQNNNVSFSAVDTNTSAHHIWNFGDGTSSSDIHVVHAYSNPGLYHVCLYVYIPGSTCVDSLCKNVQANASNCQAYFTYQSIYPPALSL